MAACERLAIPVDVAWQELSERDRRRVFEGEGTWRGVHGYFRRLERKRYKVSARMLIARYRRFDPCTACEGTRLRPEARSVAARRISRSKVRSSEA